MKTSTVRIFAILAFLSFVGVTYQNCSRTTFATSAEELASQSSIGANSILLNGGATFTTDSTVNVLISSQDSTHIYLTNDSTCSSGGDWQTISATKSWLLASPNALNTVYARFKKVTKLSEVVSDCYQASITHDDIAPVVSIKSKPATPVASASARFVMTIADDLSGLDHYECLRVGEKDFSQCSETQDYSGLSDGQNRFQVRAVDRAGNRSNVVEYSWLVDTTAPTLAITGKPDAISASAQAVFTFTADDGAGSGLSRTLCSLDGKTAAVCTSPAAYTGLLEGTHTFTVTAEDKAGNQSQLTYTWKSQGAATSDFQILGITGGTDTDKDKYLGTVLQPTVHWTASTGAASYRVSILNSAGTATVCSEVATTSTSLAFTSAQCTLVHGTSYQARVAAYTSASAIKVANNYAFTVDVQAPVITLSAPTMSDDQKQAVFSPFSIVDSVSGIKSASCVRTSGTASETVASCQTLTKITFTSLVTGDHVLTVTSTDQASNTATKSITFTAKKIVCDPFSTSTVACRQGWKGSIFYYSGTGNGWTVLDKYFSDGTDANVILYMSKVFVPTRTFSNGFPTTDGELVKKKAADGGANLVEWFGIRMKTILKLGASDTAGYYQFALISDDGSKLYVAADKSSSYSTLIDNDKNHSTKMKCSSTAIYMDANSRKPAQLDYFQGPRNHIALNLVYRKVSSTTPDVLTPCDVINTNFYGTVDNTSGVYTGSDYQKALDAGWKPLNTDNFLLDETVN